MSLIGLLFASVICTTTLSGCSSPFLPHNALRYIPEFSHEQTAEPDTHEEHSKPTEQGGNTMNEDFTRQHRSYFSPESIRERYAQHIEDGTADSSDPLLDIARETVALMRQDGKTDDEIRTELERKFHFDAEAINALLSE